MPNPLKRWEGILDSKQMAFLATAWEILFFLRDNIVAASSLTLSPIGNIDKKNDRLAGLFMIIRLYKGYFSNLSIPDKYKWALIDIKAQPKLTAYEKPIVINFCPLPQ